MKGFRRKKRYDVIEKWIKDAGYDKDTSTPSTYRSYVRIFLVEHLKLKEPNKYPKLKKQDFKADFMNYAKHIAVERGVSGNTYSGHISAIKEFFLHYDLPIPVKEEKRFRRRRYGKKINPTRKELFLDAKQISMILSHGEILEKAYFLVMLTGGLRPDEGVTLLLDDIQEFKIDDKRKLTRLNIRNAKGHIDRYTYINAEATEHLNEWLKMREEWLHNSQKRNFSSSIPEIKKELTAKGTEFKKFKNPSKNAKYKEYPIFEDNRVFPLHYSAILKRFHKMLKEADFDKKGQTNNYLVLPKMFRAYFKTYMEDKDALGIADTEKLMGHSGYLSTHYRKENPEIEKKTALAYYECQNVLNIFKSRVTDKKFKEQKQKTEIATNLIGEVVEQRKEDTKEIQSLKQQIVELNKKLKVYEIEDERVENLIRKINKEAKEKAKEEAE